MIPIVKPFIPPSDVLMPLLEKVLYSGYIAEGEIVKQFEQKFGNYISNPHALSLNSGTAALHIALILAGVKNGDEVISTPLTAEPTNVAIYQAGAKVVWADIDYNTGILLASEVEKKITKKTKAIMLVHYAGIVADMDRFLALSQKYNIPIIEDAAHALGAKYKGKYIGTISPYTIFSFQAIKHMTTIDGGMLTINNQAEHDRGRLIRWFGLDKTKPRLENDIQEVGYKYHMNNVNAVIGLIQMDYLESIVNKYISNGKYFDEAFAKLNGIECINYYEGSEPSYWLYTMKVERRSDFIRMMNEKGISASELHLRNDRHSLFKKAKSNLPNFESFYAKMVHIPCGWWVDNEARELIRDTINHGW
jgi:perosamine synthetase